MDRTTDKRNRLADQPFAYRATKDGTVFISWHGKTVTTLRGKAADRFLTSIQDRDDRAAQLLMAKTTGHFKHGAERLNQASTKAPEKNVTRRVARGRPFWHAVRGRPEVLSR